MIAQGFFLAEFLHLADYDSNFVLRRLAKQSHDRAGKEKDRAADDSGGVDAKDSSAEIEEVLEAMEAVGLGAAAETLKANSSTAGVSSSDAEEASSAGSSSAGETPCRWEESWTPLEMHALSERLRSAQPPPPEDEERRE